MVIPTKVNLNMIKLMGMVYSMIRRMEAQKLEFGLVICSMAKVKSHLIMDQCMKAISKKV